MTGRNSGFFVQIFRILKYKALTILLFKPIFVYNKGKEGFMENNNSGILSLILGIFSIICSISGSMLTLLGIPVGIVGIVVAKKSLDYEPGNSLGRAGLITSIIGIVLCSVIFIACTACIGILVTGYDML